MTTPAAESTTKVLSRQECETLWNRLDYNGNGLLSLAELDKGVMEVWPQLDHKPAIMRAYKASDVNDDGFIRKNEFRCFLAKIHFYNALWEQFASLVTSTEGGGDRRLTKQEFRTACEILHIENPDQVYAEMDTNAGGYVLFDEFCSHLSKQESERDS